MSSRLTHVQESIFHVFNPFREKLIPGVVLLRGFFAILRNFLCITNGRFY